MESERVLIMEDIIVCHAGKGRGVGTKGTGSTYHKSSGKQHKSFFLKAIKEKGS